VFPGQRVAEIARLLGMKVLVAERKGSTSCRSDRTPFDEVLRQSTVLVVAIPRTSETIGFISTAKFGMMEQSAVLVNISRDEIVDETALLLALQQGKIAGVATDVFSEEPAGLENNILLGPEAKGLNLTLTPHTVWVSNTTMKNLQLIEKQNAEAFCRGRPTNVVQ
jgi:lactate dehydrogenase-like 2-hydroxyacid dehydrogenase